MFVGYLFRFFHNSEKIWTKTFGQNQRNKQRFRQKQVRERSMFQTEEQNNTKEEELKLVEINNSPRQRVKGNDHKMLNKLLEEWMNKVRN